MNVFARPKQPLLGVVGWAIALSFASQVVAVASDTPQSGVSTADARVSVSDPAARDSDPAAGDSESAAGLQSSSPQSTPSELSVAPLDHLAYPPDRPEWLSQLPSFDGEEHHWVVIAPPCDTPEQAQELLAVLSRAAVASYVEQLTGRDAQQIRFPLSDVWINDTLVTRRYSGQVIEGDTPRIEQAVFLTFTPEVQQQIRAARQDFEIRQRLGGLSLVVLGLLCTLILGSGTLTALSRRIDKRDRDPIAA